MVPELPFEIVKSKKLALSVRLKQKDNSASSISLFDKGGATQRTRQSIYATAVAARFFFWRYGGSTPPSLTNLLETINCISLYLRTSDVQCANNEDSGETAAKCRLG